MTTELALFVTYLLGVLAVSQPALGAAAAVVVALLLAARERLHRFATQALSQAELHDALLLGALLLVLLPLLPAAPLPWLGGISPRKLLGLVVLILALQGAGHVALRAAGARAGLPLSGLLSGFVSSTATVAAMGARARATPALWRAAAAGAVMSTAATWVQASLMLAALAPTLLGRALPMVLVGASVALVCAAVLLRGLSAAATSQAPAAARGQAPLRWREALIVAALLAAAAGVVGLAERQLGESGAVLAAILPALLDAHASVAAVANLQALGRLEVDRAALAVWLAIAANGGTRSVVAGVAGGARYGAAVGAALLLSTALAGLALWISG